MKKLVFRHKNVVRVLLSHGDLSVSMTITTKYSHLLSDFEVINEARTMLVREYEHRVVEEKAKDLIQSNWTEELEDYLHGPAKKLGQGEIDFE